MRCDEILISTGWNVKERKERERVYVCGFFFELVKMSESGGGWGWIPMRWFDRSSESKGERNDGDSPGVCMLWLWLS